MSKKVVIVIALLCVAVGLGVGLLLSAHPSAVKIDIQREATTTVPAGTASGPLQSPKSLHENTTAYTVDVKYPELSQLADPQVQDKVDRAISAGVFHEAASFRATAASSSLFGQTGLQSSFNGDYTVSLLSPSFFSAVMAYSDYESGAAHPDNYIVTLDYNLKTGDAVTLDQFLRGLNPSSGYFNRLADYAKEDLKKQFGATADSLDFINTGAAPTADNYQNFALTTESLRVIFDPYQVAPGVNGAPEVDIPYDTLVKDILKPVGGGSTDASAYWWLQ